MTGRIRTVKPEIMMDMVAASLTHEGFRLFVGMITLADDYGNLRASPSVLDGIVFHARPSEHGIQVLLAELSSVRIEKSHPLIKIYRVNGQLYAHLNGWAEHQKVDHPGKPRCPGPDADGAEVVQLKYEQKPETSEILANESRDPRETLAPDLRSPISDQGPPTEGGAEPAQKRDSPPAAPAFLIFPCVPGKRTKEAEWSLTRAHLDELRKTFPGVDVEHHARRALAWLKANTSRRKTAGGMPDFLYRWMSREQDHGRGSSMPTKPSGPGPVQSSYVPRDTTNPETKRIMLERIREQAARKAESALEPIATTTMQQIDLVRRQLRRDKGSDDASVSGVWRAPDRTAERRGTE